MILTLILLGTLLIGGIFFLLFRSQSRRDFRKHQEYLTRCSEKFQLHKKQIQKRITFLNQYDMLTYNLSEVLLVQDQIKL